MHTEIYTKQVTGISKWYIDSNDFQFKFKKI